MNQALILSTTRTPIGRFNGTLSRLSITELASQLVTKTLKRDSIDPNQIDSIIVGNVLQANTGQNVARQIAAASNLPQSTNGYTVNEVCASGMRAFINAAQEVATGQSNCTLAVGVESMSRAPFLADRQPKPLGHQKLLDSLFTDGLWCGITDQHMGCTAENIAKKYSISREDQDNFALNSHQKANTATSEGHFKKEIIEIDIPSRKAPVTLTQDESIRPDTSLEALSKLRPVFPNPKKPDTELSVTAGNSSSINDGAAIALLGTEETAKNLNLKPLARILAFASTGVDPNEMGIGPVPAINKLLENANRSHPDRNFNLDQIDLFEINEAFASQSIAVLRELDLPEEKVNISGGAIALGHPLGCSGIRIITTLVHNLHRQQKTLGIASLCVGGGEGFAVLIETV